jgi:lysophospholipase L1-like esterase
MIQSRLLKYLLPLLLLVMVGSMFQVNASTTRVECENMSIGGTYAGTITSPFSGAALYANNDYCATNYNFTASTNTISVRGCSNNSSTAQVAVLVGGTQISTLNFSGTTPSVQSLSGVTTGTGTKELRLNVTTDTGAWDAYVDYVEVSDSGSSTGNLITNSDLETGNTGGWTVNGAGTIAVSTTQKHSGTYSLYHTGRTAAWNGPLSNITSQVQNGKTYTCSGWVRLDNTASAPIIMTIKKVDGSGTSYTNVATGTGSNSSWVQLSGSYTLTVSGTLNELSIYFEGPSSGINFYADDVQMNGDSSSPIKVMPLGDSITDGYLVPGGYRIQLWKDTVNNGLTVDFVGSLSNGSADLGDKNHEGHSGWRIDQLDANINAWMDAYNPQIVLLHIGTNDITQNYDLANAPSRLSALIDKICAKLPTSGKLYVAKIIPEVGTDLNQKVINFNNQIPGIVQNKVNQGKLVYVVDMYGALTTADLADTVHPNATGYNKMGDVWFNAVRNDLK